MPRQSARARRGGSRARDETQLTPSMRVLRGHEGFIVSVTTFPDGWRALSGAVDGTVRVWDLRTGVQLHRIGSYKTAVLSVVGLPDGRRVLSGYKRGALRLWDIEDQRRPRLLRGHTDDVWSLSLTPNGKQALSGSGDKTVRLWDLDTGTELRRMKGHMGQVQAVAMLPDGQRALSGSDDETIRLWDLGTGAELRRFEDAGGTWSIAVLPNGARALSGSGDHVVKLWELETGAVVHEFKGHRGQVRSLAVLPNGLQALSSSDDSTVRLWDLETGAELRRFEGHTGMVTSVAVLPDGHRLISGSWDTTLRLWDIETIGADAETVGYTTARIALLGESGVGKTGLGWRIAHGAFREHSSTHGQQFWVIDELGRTRQDGTQCEAVLWDLAGQPDYRLIHALFLDQANLGLLLFDPTNRERPLAGVEYWLRHLRAATGRATAAGESSARAGAPTLLIAARADRGTPTLTTAEIEAFCKRHEVSGYVVTSAQDNTGVPELIEQIKVALPWDRLTATTTTRTFKRIKEHVLKLKELGGATFLLPPAELRQQLEAGDGGWHFTDDEMMTAVGHLENHGYVARLRRANGEEAILLTPDLLVNLASSIVLEARRHERGLGLLDEARLLAGDYRFPELDGLSGTDRSTLLDAVASLFLRRNLCFRETLNDRTCLVFPSLINEKRPPAIETGADDVSYRVSGAVETVYAALVVQLGYTNLFRSDAHWQNQAQYELEPGEICGFRQIDEREGEIELVLSYSSGAGEDTRKLFQGAFERFLKRRPVEIGRLPMVACRRGHPQLRDAIREALDNSQTFFFCSKCGAKVRTPRVDDIGVSADTVVREAEERADDRTKYEVAVAWTKAFRRDRGDGDKRPSCFISYAWGDPKHERWVELLADHLQNADVAVALDRWHSRPAAAISRFIERIEGSEFVCAVGTPRYRQKDQAEDSDPVVQAELRLIKSKLMSRDLVHDTVIPLLCAGTREESFPPLFKDSVFLDFRSESDFFPRLFELVLTIHQIPFEDKMARQHRDELSGASEIDLRLGRGKQPTGQPRRRVSSI
jgi:GTPase SAR1 family protein